MSKFWTKEKEKEKHDDLLQYFYIVTQSAFE